ncbi:unnamed protein product, partial [Adineta steineri]
MNNQRTTAQATFEFAVVNRRRSSSVPVHGPLLAVSWPRMPPTYSV